MADDTTATTASQYLTFSLDKEQFAVDIHKVREVLQTSCGGVQPISRPPARVRVAPRSHPATRSLALCAAR